MGNIAVFDESKGSDGSIYCFAGIVYKDNNVFSDIEIKLSNLKNLPKYANIGEIKSSSLQSSNTLKIDFLNEAFRLLINTANMGQLRILYYITYGNDFNYSTIDLKNIIESVFKQVTDVKLDSNIEKLLYYQLSVFFMKNIHELPFDRDAIEKIISDNTFSLENKNDKPIGCKGNATLSILPLKDVSAMVIENVHNALFGKILSKPVNCHNGLKELVFIDSKKYISIQLCDVLSNFLMASIKYLYFKSLHLSVPNTDFKYNFLAQYITGLENIPFGAMNLALLNKIDVSATKKFDPICGKIP